MAPVCRLLQQRGYVAAIMRSIDCLRDGICGYAVLELMSSGEGAICAGGGDAKATLACA